MDRALGLAKSQSAKDTYVLFAGNVASAFLGFLFTLLIARGLSVGDFGVFSAVNNLVTMIASLADIGISAALISFVSNYHTKGDTVNAWRYLKASFVARIIVVSLIVLAMLALAPIVGKKLLASNDISVVYWSVVLSIGFLIWAYFTVALQAYRRFVASVSVDMFLGVVRVLSVGAFFFAGILTLTSALLSFAMGALAAILVGFYLLGTSFLTVDTPVEIYSKLLRFSGWVGVNRVVSAISGRLDVTMLAAMAGATVTGQYSIAQRLALFITVLVASLSSVMAPRLSSFGNKAEEKKYIIKATLTTLAIVAGVMLWIIIASPFITLLFGEKYLPAVPIFQVFLASLIPFILSSSSVSAIIYSIKKPVYIGYFSFFQLAAIFLISLVLIPKIGAYGPLVAYFAVNTILAVYSWTIVIRYYWRN